MAAYENKTFLDLVTAVREELGIQAADTVSINKIKRIINDVYQQEVGPFKQWPWLRGTVNVSHEPATTLGTASVIAGTVTVTLTNAPAYSRKGENFSVDGFNEVYRIAQHTAASTTLVLETPYAGGTDAVASYKIWSESIALPGIARETIKVGHYFSDTPLDGVGFQKYREIVAAFPKSEGRPACYSTNEAVDPAPYSAISGLPALTSRSSNGLVKTLVFAADVSSYLAAGNRIEISGCPEHSYNGEVVLGSVTTTTITYTGLTALYETATADLALSLKLQNTRSADETYKRLFVHPSINSVRTTLLVDYLKEIAPLVNDTDQPLMPYEDRIVLKHGALSIAWSSLGRNPEEGQRNAVRFEAKLNRMAGRLDDSTDQPVLRPSKIYLGAKRANSRQRDSRYSMAGMGGGSSNSQAPIQGTASTVAVFNSSGELQGSSTITTTELGQIDGAASQILGKDDSGTLTNKTISALSNTLSNISNSNLASNAAITRDKIASGTANHVLINDASGNLSSEVRLAVTRGGTNSGATLNNSRVMVSSGSAIVEASAITGNRVIVSNSSGIPVHSATTDTEVGYLSGVTSSVQTQLNGALTLNATQTLTNKTLTTPIINGVEWSVSAVKTANYTIPITDGIVLGNSSGGTFTFTLPSPAAGLEFQIQKVLADTSVTAITISGTGLSTTLNTSGESVTVFSDGSNWFVLARSIPSLMTSYSPTMVGFGSPTTGNEFFWRRTGDSIHIWGRFVTATTTAVEARIPFPSGLTSSAHGSIKVAGLLSRNDATVRNYRVLSEQSVAYATFSVQDGTRLDLAKANGNDITGSGVTMSLNFTVPITGWNG